MHNDLVSLGYEGEVLLGDTHNKGHEGFLCGFDQFQGEVGRVHITPLQRLYHLHQRLDDHDRKVGVTGGEDQLFLGEDGREDLAQGEC